MMNLKFAYMISAAAFALSAVPANAATLLFTLSGARNATFQLDSNPVPTTSSTSFIGKQIQFSNVAGTFNGVAGIAPSISFGTDLIAALNINGTSLGFTQFAGPAIFTGPAASPIFSPGTFQLTNFVFGGATLTVTETVAAVPEPATWAMMITGFGFVGGAMRNRQRKTKTRIAFAFS